MTLAWASAISPLEVVQPGSDPLQPRLAFNCKVVAPALNVRETGENPDDVQVPVPVPPLGDARLTDASPKTAHRHVPEKDCSEVPAGAVNAHWAEPPGPPAALDVKNLEDVKSLEVNTAVDDVPTLAAIPAPGGHPYEVVPLPLTVAVQALLT